MGMQRRQDIQCVTIKAEQLNFLMQTIFTHHKDFDCHQLDGVLGKVRISRSFLPKLTR